MNEQNRISIRINGKEPIEKAKAVKETAAAGDKSEHFNWVLPEEMPNQGVTGIKKARKGSGKRRKKTLGRQAPGMQLHRKRRKPIHRKTKRKQTVPKSQWFSGIAAVAVGLIMGLMVLSIFTNPPHLKQVQNPDTAGHSANQASAPADQTGNVLAAAKDLNLSLQVIQGGVFSTDANGQVAESKLQNGGFAAVLNDNNGKVYMYIGISTDKAQASEIAGLYKQNGQEVYVKPLQIQVNKDKLDKKTKRVLSMAKPVIMKLIQGSGGDLTGGKPSVSDGEWEKIKNQIEGLKHAETKPTKKLVQNLEQASASFAKYRSHSDQSNLWQVQQSLLLAVSNYQQIGEGNK